MSKSLDMLTEAATMLGRQHGEQQAKWVDSYPLSAYAAKAIIKGYEANHEQTLDLCPNPLTNNYDGEEHLRIIDQIANLAEAAELISGDDIEKAIDQSSNILDVYEAAFKKAFWDRVIAGMNKIVEVA